MELMVGSVPETLLLKHWVGRATRVVGHGGWLSQGGSHLSKEGWPGP